MCQRHVKGFQLILVLLRSVPRLRENENSCNKDNLNIDETFVKTLCRRQAYWLNRNINSSLHNANHKKART